MKSACRNVQVKIEKPFEIRRDVRSHGNVMGHYHPQLELHYVVRGEGIRVVGDVRSSFSSGEMVLMGANLPHAWSVDDNYLVEGAARHIDVIVVNFTPEFFGKQFFQIPETVNINKLFERANLGLEFSGKTRETAASFLLSATESNGFDQIVIFLQILNLLADSNEFKSIAKGRNMLFQRNESDTRRLNTVTDYTLNNYRREISLEEISSLCHLSVTSFCRYFKSLTDKTYLDFLTEIRVSHACKLILEDRFTVEIICFECGFKNISNFYRHFKKVIGSTPQEYRKKYLLGRRTRIEKHRDYSPAEV